MPSINATLFKFEFKRKEYSKAFSDGLLIKARNAAREFARTVASIVPIRTGFARGALRNLNTAIGISSVSDAASFIAREKRKSGKERNPSIVEYYYGHGGKVLKTPENARNYSTPPAKVFSIENGILYFNYNVTILYYVVNEHIAKDGVRNAPWKSFERGREAFVSYLKDVGIKRLPAVKSYVVKTEVKVDKTTVTKGQSKTLDKVT